MEYVKLEEICTIVSGGTPSRSKPNYWNNGNIPWIKIKDMKSKYIDSAEEFITEEGLNNSSTKMLKSDTILYSIFATLGEVGILKIDACTNQAIAGLSLKEDSNILKEYLYYYLKSKKKDVNNLGRGVAQNNINLSLLRKFKIPVMPLHQQETIVEVLDNVSSTMNNYERELELLDELVKARFVEMFGTIRENPHNYPRVTLKEVCHKITDGKHGGCKQEDNSGYYYVGAREIYDGKIHYNTAPQITYDDFSKDYRRCNIEKGDMVIVNTGATIGKSAIASSPLTEKTLLQKSVALIKVNTDIIIADFLRYCYMLNPSMYMVKSASAQPNLLLSKMNSTIVYLPPIDLQRQFASFVEEIDKSRLLSNHSLSLIKSITF